MQIWVGGWRNSSGPRRRGHSPRRREENLPHHCTRNPLHLNHTYDELLVLLRVSCASKICDRGWWQRWLWWKSILTRFKAGVLNTFLFIFTDLNFEIYEKIDLWLRLAKDYGFSKHFHSSRLPQPTSLLRGFLCRTNHSSFEIILDHYLQYLFIYLFAFTLPLKYQLYEKGDLADSSVLETQWSFLLN